MDRPSIIARALGTARKLAGSDVVYDTGTIQIPIRAGVGSTGRNQIDSNSTFTRIHTKDFLISVAELRLGNTAIVPQKGHTIRQSLHGKTSVFELLPLGDEPCWRYSDPDETEYRIHTKLIRTES